MKLGFPFAFTATMLSWGQILYGRGSACAGQAPYVHRTLRWFTDYMVKCHTSPLELYAQVPGHAAAAAARATSCSACFVHTRLACVAVLGAGGCRRGCLHSRLSELTLSHRHPLPPPPTICTGGRWAT